MGKNRFAYALTVGALGLFWLLDGRWISWILLLWVLILPWLSLALSWSALRSLRVEVVPERFRRGQRGELWLIGSCGSAVPGFRGSIRLRRCFTGEERRYRPEEGVPVRHCGGYLARLEKVKSSDYLGIFSFRPRIGEPVLIPVYPEPVPGPLPEEVPVKEHQRGEDWDLREYRPGDSLRRIHWKLSAKQGSLITRIPEEPEPPVPILSIELRGSDDLLDEKLGQLLWTGEQLLQQGRPFLLQAQTGAGAAQWHITDREELLSAMDSLLGSPIISGDTIRGI